MQTSQLKRRKIEAPYTNCLNASSTKDAENKNTVVYVKHCRSNYFTIPHLPLLKKEPHYTKMHYKYNNKIKHA